MKILLTGGAGFVGQYLAKHLVSDGHSVTALDSLSPQVHQDPQASAQRFPGPVVQRDVADPGLWHLVGSVDAVVHLAAETGTGQSMYQQDRLPRQCRRGHPVGRRASARWGARWSH
ncbi:MAG: NAD(P)-dependent oxidoreductase [Marmoricola sp.]